ncbi:carbonic anhydrase [Fimbriiglobus ruber]|uniref:Carbonic anhydrase n=1 Tax=Fimbriiglobus ruber TaxID=1908690 RepID=A0A225DHW6_9BACT|nr:carbonic anhydrase [Fimbriiglobus ruber]OWK40593.1 Carbonic anhydrase [Fimbriiglobus ruber]
MSNFLHGGATRLIEGVGKFRRGVFGTKKSLFHRLKDGQSPLAVFITCSDSRINPNLLTQTEPGELFILRNAGNLVPPHSAGPSGEGATVEYAVTNLKIHDVVVCGHSHCGAMQGLLSPEALEKMPTVREWLRNAAAVVTAVEAKGPGLTPAQKLELAVQQNTLVQIEHLKTHPAVAEAMAAGRLRLHAWVYHFETGEVDAHDAGLQRFVPLAEATRPHWTPADKPAGPLGSMI